MNSSNSLNEQVKYFYIDAFVLFMLSILYLSMIFLLAAKFKSFESIYIDLFYSMMICSIAVSSINVLPFYILKRTARNEDIFLKNNLFAHTSVLVVQICTYLSIVSINIYALRKSAKIFIAISNHFQLTIDNHFQLLITCLMLLYLPTVAILGVAFAKAIIAIQKIIDSNRF